MRSILINTDILLQQWGVGEGKTKHDLVGKTNTTCHCFPAQMLALILPLYCSSAQLVALGCPAPLEAKATHRAK